MAVDFYHGHGSPFSWRVWLALEAKGIPYNLKVLSFQNEETKKPEFRAINPRGLVPTIVDDGFVLWEANAIMRYLATKHGADKLYPTELKRRADVERWLDWCLCTLTPAITPMFLGLYRTPEPQRDKAAIEASRLKTADAVRILDAELAKRPYVSGDSFTVADIACGIFAGYRWFNFPIERPDFPNVKAWYERLAQRAAFKEHVMIGIT